MRPLLGYKLQYGLVFTRALHTSPVARQLEALGVLVDAAEKANEEIEKDSAKKPAKRGPRASRSRKPGNQTSQPDPPRRNGGKSSQNSEPRWWQVFWQKRLRTTLTKAAEAAVIMTSGLAMLGFAGLMYHRAYRRHTLLKMEDALDTWDPVLEMSCHYKKIIKESDWVERPQQALLDDIIAGKVRGRYYVLLGEKGTGKTSMILHAVEQVRGNNVVVMDAHGDPEIFRQRLGKALSFEFHEDYWGGLFSLRGPRENTFLDIERVFNVLEEVAVRRYRQKQRPLCLLINKAHLIKEDEDGKRVLTLLQQKAESFSGSGIANIVFNSDDYWLYQRLMQAQTRMDAISVSDLSKPDAIHILRRLRKSILNEEVSDNLANSVYYLVGGRPQHLAAVAGCADMLRASQLLIDREKQWFLNNCGLLGGEMDDDVMDSGKFSVSGMRLAQAFVNREQEAGELLVSAEDGTRELPRIPLWRARQIMTRPDFIREFDNRNFFTLDAFSRVKPDSVLMMHAFREIVNMPGFADLLAATMDRIDDIESLNRTREVCLKDLGGGGGRELGTLVFKDNQLSLQFPAASPCNEDPAAEEDSALDDAQAMMLDRYGHEHWSDRIKAIRQETSAHEQAAAARQAERKAK